MFLNVGCLDIFMFNSLYFALVTASDDRPYSVEAPRLLRRAIVKFTNKIAERMIISVYNSNIQ